MTTDHHDPATTDEPKIARVGPGAHITVDAALDLAQLAEARDEAADDLRRLRVAYRNNRRQQDEPAVVAAMVQGLLDAPEWTQLELATALIEAIAILEESR